MQHLPHLIQDLGFILITAAIVSLLCRRLHQPVVLGYLIAGFLLGPSFSHYHTIRDTRSVQIWAEIGVIFLLFGLGLEFSFKKLKKVGKSASITAAFKIIFMFGLGYLAGQAWGWSWMDSLFMGGILSISSTAIIVRAFGELGLKGRNFVQLVFGVLIIEDLIAILLLVVLSSLAATKMLSGADLAFVSAKLIFFLVLLFLLGIYLLPIFMRKFAQHLSDEIMLIVSLGLCLMLVIVATQVGFSPALGAFVMGSLLAETREGHRIEKLIVPVRDLFSAVFFVSVGMLIDPRVLVDYYDVIFFFVVVNVVGKVLSTVLGALISGRSLKTSVQAGMSMAQIGEFSFIIATLGMSLKVTSDFLYPIAVAVSAVTTFSTPYFIRASDKIFEFIDHRIPNSVRQALSRYEAAMATNSDSDNPLSLLWEEYGMKLLSNSVMVIAISLALENWGWKYVLEKFGYNTTFATLACIFTLICTGPFLWAVFFGKPAHEDTYVPSTLIRLRRLQLGVAAVRFIIGVILVSFVIGQYISIRALSVSGGVVLALAVVGVFFLTRTSETLYQKIEGRFIKHLNESEKLELELKLKTPELAPWSASLTEFVVSVHSPLAGKTLQQAGLKEMYGITVAMIERGGKRILAPTRDDLILPLDRMFLIGTDDELASVRDRIETADPVALPPVSESFGLTSLTLLPTDPFVNKTIRECGIREMVNGLIVGLERGGERYLSPDSSIQLQVDDLVWIVGDRNLINNLRS